MALRRHARIRRRTQLVELGDGIRLLPTQERFAGSPCRHKAYVGPMGSGKSLVLCLVCLILAASVPGNAGVIGRYSRFDFNRTTRVTLERLLPDALVERQLANGEGWILRTTDPDRPSTLYTAHFDEPGPYASMDLGFFGIDEVNGDDLSPSVPEPVFQMLAARLGRLAHVRRPYGLLAGNPQGHNWVWKRFHLASPDRVPDHEMFTPAPYENAPNLQAGYYERLERENGAEWVARYVMGSHEVFEGQVYPELSESRHLIAPFSIPPTWPRIVALDHGLRNPTAALFIAIGFDGELYVYDEHHEAGRTVDHHAAKIRTRLESLAKAREVTWVADPSIFAQSFQKAGKVYSVYDEYADAGLDQWTPGENDVAAGRNRIKHALASGKLKFFAGCVPNCWREMQGLHWKRLRTLTDRDAPEQEADVNNHCPDALRYALMTRPDPAVRARPLRPVTHQDRRLRRLRDDQREAIRAAREQGRRGAEEYV